MANNKLKVIKQDNRKLKLNYFVWGTIDGKDKSFYLSQIIDGFMKNKTFQSLQLQVYALKYCQGLSLAKDLLLKDLHLISRNPSFEGVLGLI